MGLQRTHQWLVCKSLTNQTVINRFWIVSTTNTSKISQMTRWIMINLSQMLSSLSFTNNSALVQINCQINKFSPSSSSLRLLAILQDLWVAFLEPWRVLLMLLMRPWMTTSNTKTVWFIECRSTTSSIAQRWTKTLKYLRITQTLGLLPCHQFHHASLGPLTTSIVPKNSGCSTITCITIVTRFLPESRNLPTSKDSSKNRESLHQIWWEAIPTLRWALMLAQDMVMVSPLKPQELAPQVHSSPMATQAAHLWRISIFITLIHTSVWAIKTMSCTTIRKFSLSNSTQHSKICTKTTFKWTAIAILCIINSSSSSRSSRRQALAQTKSVLYSNYSLTTLSNNSERTNSLITLMLSVTSSSKRPEGLWSVFKMVQMWQVNPKNLKAMEMLSVASSFSRKMRTI